METKKKVSENLVFRACHGIEGFSNLYEQLEKHISITGKSRSTLNNYGRHVAQVALHFTVVPTKLSVDQIQD